MGHRRRRRYELRWKTEYFFRVLTIGTRIESRRPGTADNLRKCFAFDAVTAYRIRGLKLPVRERSDDID